MKAAMLALSSFQEVLMLDADQVPVWDVTELFEDPDYVRTGALLWPDFWDASWAPDAPAALGLPASRLPTGTFESGQLLFDKARCVAVVPGLHVLLDVSACRLARLRADSSCLTRPGALLCYRGCMCCSMYRRIIRRMFRSSRNEWKQ